MEKANTLIFGLQADLRPSIMSTDHLPAGNAKPRLLDKLSPLAVIGMVSLPLPFVIHQLGLDRLGVQTCGFRAATGYACPSCGTTRAWGSLGHGDLIGAFTYNPVFTAAWFVLVAIFVAEVLGLNPVAKLSRWWSWAKPGWRRRALITMSLIVVAVNWAYLIVDGR